MLLYKQINKSSTCVRAARHLLPGPTRRVIHVYQQPPHACGHLHRAHACTHRGTPSPLYPYAELMQKVLDAYSTKAPPLPNPPELKGTWKTMWPNAFPHRSFYRRENRDAERDSEPVRAPMETVMSQDIAQHPRCPQIHTHVHTPPPLTPRKPAAFLPLATPVWPPGQPSRRAGLTIPER